MTKARGYKRAKAFVRTTGMAALYVLAAVGLDSLVGPDACVAVRMAEVPGCVGMCLMAGIIGAGGAFMTLFATDDEIERFNGKVF